MSNFRRVRIKETRRGKEDWDSLIPGRKEQKAGLLLACWNLLSFFAGCQNLVLRETAAQALKLWRPWDNLEVEKALRVQ